LTKKKKSVQLRENRYLEDYYAALLEGRQDKVFLYHSDVFYVRTALATRLGYVPSLLETDMAMRACGWDDGPIKFPDR
jgi:hypothetical protein